MSAEKPTRPRPTRAAEVTQERQRRRTNFDASFDLQLPIDEARLDPSFTYRWVNDLPARVQKLTLQDDWEIVSSDEAGVGTIHHVGYHRDGTSMKCVLLKKPLKWHEEDQARKIARTRELEDGQMASAGEQLGAQGYVPRNIDNSVRAGSSRSYVPDIKGTEDE